MITMTKFRTVQASGLNVFYREAGENGAPRLLLLGGFPSSSHQFHLIPALADRSHIVSFDYPGFGNTDMPDPSTWDYTPDPARPVYDYRTNAALYPTWVERLRATQPKTIIFLGSGRHLLYPGRRRSVHARLAQGDVRPARLGPLCRGRLPNRNCRRHKGLLRQRGRLIMNNSKRQLSWAPAVNPTTWRGRL
jgi:hypothetical protein